MTKAKSHRGKQPIKPEPCAHHHHIDRGSPTPSLSETYDQSAAQKQQQEQEQQRLRQTSSFAPAHPNQSFIRSDAPTPSIMARTMPARSVRTTFTNPTADESEPVLLQVRNREMEPPVHPAQNESFFDGSFRDIGAKLKIFNDTLGELQQLGVSHDVALPQLVLVGDQSAGKSSLMSGLAGLNLPRSEGVCTRCPIHIRVSSSGSRERGGPEWSCRVSLQQDYAYQPPPGHDIAKADVTPQNPFPPWVKQQRVVKEFMTIYNQDDIDTVLRWAQVAILNHDQNHELYVPETGAITKQRILDEEAENTAAKFSPNTVALEIKGPDLPDLSFYDMPGIFRNSAREEDEYLVSVVENLAREYISHTGALIIWAVPMNVDPETSSTLSIIRDLRAQHRTIGVMTKADLLPEGNNAQWLSMLRAERHKIGHEFFITSRPSDKGLEEQQRWEEALFHDNASERWPEEFHAFRDRCGVEKLKTALSEKLGKEFAKNLPSIKQKVLTRLGEIEAGLSTLPELPNNVELEVRKSLMQFSNIVKDTLRDRAFSSNYGNLSKAFRNCIVQMKPKFTLKDPSDTPVLEISDDDNNEQATPNVTPGNRKRGSNGYHGNAMAKRPRASINVNAESFSAAGIKTEDHDSNPSTPSRRRMPQQLPIPPPFHIYAKHGAGFRTLRQIREDIKAKTKAGTPSLVPDEVYEDLCKQAVRAWDQPMGTFLEETMGRLQKIVSHALDQAFGSLKRRLIFKESKAHMDNFLEERRLEALTFLKDIYAMETFQMFTINDDAFGDYERSELRTLIRYRHVMRWQAFSGELADFHDWDKMSLDQRVQEEKRHNIELAKMGPDTFDKELKVAAYVRGYYMLAAHRFADTVCLSITSRMMPKIVQDLDFYLDRQLGLIGSLDNAAFTRLMEEDDATARRRERLKGELEKFKKALQSITTNDLDVVPESSSQGNTQHEWYAESAAETMEIDFI